MNVNITIESAAQVELEQACSYYQEHASSKVAARFLTQFSYAVECLEKYPELGSPVSKRLRKLPLRQFPYSLIYHYKNGSLTILAVASQRRRPDYWIKQR